MYKDELNVIKQAILNEVEGYEFYKLAAGQVDDSGSKEALLELANEELKHVEYLKKLFDKIKIGVEDDQALAFEEGPPSPNLYNWDRFDKSLTSLAMSVFGIGIQLEQDAIEFYTKAKNESKLEAAQKLYDILIKWEKVHLEQFTAQYDIYKEDWWSDQGFAPF